MKGLLCACNRGETVEAKRKRVNMEENQCKARNKEPQLISGGRAWSEAANILGGNPCD